MFQQTIFGESKAVGQFKSNRRQQGTLFETRGVQLDPPARKPLSGQTSFGWRQAEPAVEAGLAKPTAKPAPLGLPAPTVILALPKPADTTDEVIAQCQESKALLLASCKRSLDLTESTQRTMVDQNAYARQRGYTPLHAPDKLKRNRAAMSRLRARIQRLESSQ